MDFVIEDGYNTAYISVLFMALFFDKSMIERHLLIDNNSNNFDGLYLQKLIMYNFVKQIRNNMCVTSKMLNEIRLCAITSGWKTTNNIFEMYSEADPIDFLCFILKLINFIPLEIVNNKTAWNTTNTLNKSKKETQYDKYLINPTAKSNIQDTYDFWSSDNQISNIPIFIIFKINNIKSSFGINKKIVLFHKNHQYHSIKWIFHSLLYKDENCYKTIINKDSKLLQFNQNEFPNIKHLDNDTIKNIGNKTIYVIYRKEPTI